MFNFFVISRVFVKTTLCTIVALFSLGIVNSGAVEIGAGESTVAKGPVVGTGQSSRKVSSVPDPSQSTGPCTLVGNAERFVVCRFPHRADFQLFLNNRGGEKFRNFNRLKEQLSSKEKNLVFAMNAGMYHSDREPVGLYVENGVAFSRANRNDGPGNFHLKPNGIFAVTEEGVVVRETEAFLNDNLKVRFATQSGPMLVIDGKIHPKFIDGSDSRKRRNGVGVTGDGEVVFVLADTPVNFYDFAVFFRDTLHARNALFLDGTISRLYAPELTRNDPGAAMGPIVGVVE